MLRSTDRALRTLRALRLPSNGKALPFRGNPLRSHGEEHVIDQLRRAPPYRPFGFGDRPVGLAARWCRPVFITALAPVLARAQHGLMRRLFRSFEVTGLEKIPRPQKNLGILFASNHSSYLDPPLLGCTLTARHKLPPWFMAKDRLWERRGYRMMFPALGALPINRFAKGTDYVRTLLPFASLLLGGQSVAIFPEGTIPGEVETGENSFMALRSKVDRDTGLLPFGTLLLELALATGAPIVPVGISGTSSAEPPEVDPLRLLPRRTRSQYDVRIAFGEPLHPSRDFDLSQGFPSGPQLFRYQKRTVMPAVSRLVDFSRHEVPMTLPLDDLGRSRIRLYEEHIAVQLEEAGRNVEAKAIRDQY